MTTRGRSDDRGAERIGDLLRPLIRELRRVGARVGRDLHEAWMQVAGPELAARTRLQSYRNGKLVVEVSSAPLLHELQSFRAQAILEALRRRISDPPIDEIRFRLGAFAPGGPAAN